MLTKCTKGVDFSGAEIEVRVEKFGTQSPYFSVNATVFPGKAPINSTNTMEIKPRKNPIKGGDDTKQCSNADL